MLFVLEMGEFTRHVIFLKNEFAQYDIFITTSITMIFRNACTETLTRNRFKPNESILLDRIGNPSLSEIFFPVIAFLER